MMLCYNKWPGVKCFFFLTFYLPQLKKNITAKKYAKTIIATFTGFYFKEYFEECLLGRTMQQ